MEYRKISTVLKRYSFEQKMSIAHEYSIPWVNGVDESLAQTGLPLPWELETFVLFSVTSREWCNNSFDIKNQHIFSEIITSIRNYKPPKIQAVTGTPMLIKKLLTSVGITQFEIQEKPINKLFRYNYFFNFSNDRIDMPTVFREKFGCSYKEVLSAILGVLLSYSVLKEGLSPKEFAALYRLYPEVINILCIPRDDYISKLSKITSDYRDYNYCLRPSYSYPFIVDNNVIYLPLPHLLLQSITSSLLFRLTDGRNDLQKTIGKEVIEAYLFKIICASKAFDEVLSEKQYSIGHQHNLLTADVMARKNNYVVFFDSKSFSPKSDSRILLDNAIEADITRMADGTAQIYKHIHNKFQTEYDFFEFEANISMDYRFGLVVIKANPHLPLEDIYRCAAGKLDIDIDSPEYVWLCLHIGFADLYDVERFCFTQSDICTVLLNRAASGELYSPWLLELPGNNEDFICREFKDFADKVYASALESLKEIECAANE